MRQETDKRPFRARAGKRAFVGSARVENVECCEGFGEFG